MDLLKQVPGLINRSSELHICFFLYVYGFQLHEPALARTADLK